MGGVTSCSNGSDDPEATPNPDVPEGWTEINVGDIEKYNGQDGTTAYSVTKNGDGSITISHDGTMGKYASCSFKPNFGENNTLYTKITNNSEVEATVQVQVNKAGTEANKYQPDPTVISVYVDGEKRSDASEYSVELKIAANASVVIANKFDIEKNPDTVAISLNSQESVAGTVEKGNITVSGISMKKITDEDESELETSKDTNSSENAGPEQTPPEGEGTTPPITDNDNNQTDGEGEGTTPPVTDNDNSQTGGEEEGLVFDFTNAVVDEEVKINKVTYCSVEFSSFSQENGLTLTVNNSWEGAFKISTESLDLSDKKCIIEYKIDNGWEYTSNDGKKCLLQLISKEQTSGEYKAIELSQGEFANDPATTESWQKATVENIYKNDWDAVNESGDKLSDTEKKEYTGADLTKIVAIKINTTDGKGTIHIKSLKFVDKQ